MRIASLLVRTPAHHLPEVRQTLHEIPGVQVHLQDDARGSLIVTVEDGEGYAVADTIIAVSTVPHTMSTTLIYEYNDEHTQPTEA